MARKKRKGSKGKKGPKREGYARPLAPEAVRLLEAQHQRFVEKFGRPPGPNDPVFFDPTADEPRQMIDEVLDQTLLEAMHQANIHPAFIYAYQKTGRLVSRENQRYLTKAELAEWQRAIAEWYEAHPGRT